MYEIIVSVSLGLAILFHAIVYYMVLTKRHKEIQSTMVNNAKALLVRIDNLESELKKYK